MKQEKKAKGLWDGRTVLITGGTGLLGVEVISLLLDRGAKVVALIRNPAAKSRFFFEGFDKKVSIEYGDTTETTLVKRVLSKYNIDTVFHLAGQSVTSKAIKFPAETFEANIKGTWAVLEAVRTHQNKLRGVVIASSIKAYGPSEAVVCHEGLPLAGKYPYDVSKSCSDLIAQSYSHTYNLPISIVRCSNLYGPGDLNFSRIIPDTINSVLQGRRPVIKSDGKYVVNYVYIKDAADGYLTIAQEISKTSGKAFNLSSDDRFSVLEITNLIIELMKADLAPVVKNEIKTESKELSFDLTKIKSVLGWSAQYTARKGLLETIRWYKKYAKQFQ